MQTILRQHSEQKQGPKKNSRKSDTDSLFHIPNYFSNLSVPPLSLLPIAGEPQGAPSRKNGEGKDNDDDDDADDEYVQGNYLSWVQIT